VLFIFHTGTTRRGWR